MAKIKRTPIKETKFSREDSVVINGFEITKGDLIKVKGVHGSEFKFDSLTTNTETGASWVDCFEIFRGKAMQYRAFNTDRIKRVAKRGKRAKRVND